MTIKNLRLGLAIGHGTGQELIAVFKKVIQALASKQSLNVEFIEASRIYHSYHTLTVSGVEKDLVKHIADETSQDAEDYRNFCETAAANGIAAIFRTAIHAQSLYLVRDQLKAVKIEHFDLGNSNALLFIRDEGQGFYAGVNEYHNDNHSITRTSPFSRSNFDQILAYSLQRAAEEWGEQNVPKSVTLVYKFHLFDGVFQAWAPHWTSRFGIDVDFIQPDTMNRNLMASGVHGRRIIIAGNEYADIIQPVFLKWFGNSTIETMYAENVYLSPSLHHLSEYQTVHGSADAIAGQGLVNPFATIRAAAAILERHGGCPGAGFQRHTERAIESLLMRRLTTPDQGGSCSTDAVVEHFLYAIDDTIAPETAPIRDDTASEPANAWIELSNTIPRLIQGARSKGSEVIFVRFLGNTSFQGPNWKYRNALLGKTERCVEGTWGAELGPGVTPEPGEQVFNKKALFDPFLVPEFSEYIAKQGFEHLMLAGLYSDVCVDATARTAFQKGLWVTVVEDCTAALHSNQSDHLMFMEKVYGARIMRAAALFGLEA
ncbi:hypothetical protein CNMCM7691_000765 [Aspergillus felis]|uniref:Isopropylmalate dehydrogenase-like domain-containing protein n=1 Tax=Aspergillus felis TaxID=1287682 RepID=A0A8H6QWN7_9EURO|nr:hypothetical protein CNMCM7691_000765 [Aspergillus felis]